MASAVASRELCLPLGSLKMVTEVVSVVAGVV